MELKIDMAKGCLYRGFMDEFGLGKVGNLLWEALESARITVGKLMINLVNFFYLQRGILEIL